MPVNSIRYRDVRNDSMYFYPLLICTLVGLTTIYRICGQLSCDGPLPYDQYDALESLYISTNGESWTYFNPFYQKVCTCQKALQGLCDAYT